MSVAAGQSLQRMRRTAGLDPAIPTRNIVMMGLRDVDPLEQVLIDESHITTVTPRRFRGVSSRPPADPRLKRWRRDSAAHKARGGDAEAQQKTPSSYFRTGF